MRKMVFTVMVVAMGASALGRVKYGELISLVSKSCENPVLLLSSDFTNDVISYKRTCTDVQGQCAADLALAISLMHRMDHDEACSADDECFRRHQSLVSNIVYCSGLSTGSWIGYAAAAQYISGLNYNNQQDEAFVLATNMIVKIQNNRPDMGMTNYWNSMSSWMNSTNESLLTVFRLNASIWLAEHGRAEEILPLTNSLPASAIRIFFEELE